MSTRQGGNQLPKTFLRPVRDLFSSSRTLRSGSICFNRGCKLLSLAILLCVSAVSWAQPKSDLTAPPPLDPAEGERQARVLVARLLEQKPEQAVTNSGVLKIRDAQGQQHEVSARFEVVPGPDRWLNIYEAAGPDHQPPVALTIVHLANQPNEYLWTGGERPGAENKGPRKLRSDELTTPFAGSDFWVVDLGLDFLHWPQQRVLRKQMRKGLSCDVLQSVQPKPAAGGYSRVLSWIAINRPEDIVIVHAEAFDNHDKLLKEFDPKKVEKVNGLWQLEEMEIRNRQAGTRTRIDFNLDGQ
jgi:hypothetical protein